jgi:hypothetical protein
MSRRFLQRKEPGLRSGPNGTSGHTDTQPQLVYNSIGENGESQRDSCLDQCAGTDAFTQLFIVLAAASKLTNMAITNVELLKLGLRIKTSRKVLGRNQKDFSKQCGLNRSYFGGVERGERNLTFFSLCQICAGLNCDIASVTKGIPQLRTIPK